MPEIKEVGCSIKEVATLILRSQGIHEGHWEPLVNFAMTAAPFNEMPAGIIAIRGFSIGKIEKATKTSVDAAEVNPVPADDAFNELLDKSRRKAQG